MQAAPNVTMGQLGPMDNRGQTYNQPNTIHGMQTAGGPHMNPQWQQTGPRQQQPNPGLSQLQRQLSGNSQQHNPYHQPPY